MNPKDFNKIGDIPKIVDASEKSKALIYKLLQNTYAFGTWILQKTFFEGKLKNLWKTKIKEKKTMFS